MANSESLAAQLPVNGSCLNCKRPGLGFSVYNESGPALLDHKVVIIGEPDTFAKFFDRAVVENCPRRQLYARCEGCGIANLKYQYLFDGRLPYIKEKPGQYIKETCILCDEGAAAAAYCMKYSPGVDDSLPLINLGWMPDYIEKKIGTCVESHRVKWICSAKKGLHEYCSYIFVIDGCQLQNAAAALDAAAAAAVNPTMNLNSPQHAPHAHASTGSLQHDLVAAQFQGGAGPSVASGSGGSNVTGAPRAAAAAMDRGARPTAADQQPPRRDPGSRAARPAGTGAGTAEQTPSRLVGTGGSRPPNRLYPPAHVRRRRGGQEYKDARENGVCERHRRTKTRCDCPPDSPNRIPAREVAARSAGMRMAGQGESSTGSSSI